ncbi:hypothetical protein LTR17_009148 [Elasticomyces elasticus]|nr:hypothetical protein LTR17_009148 [Elasticomyces elasticus]
MSAIIGTEQYNPHFNTAAGIIQGAIGASLSAGRVIGSVVAGPISNWMGRSNSSGFACVFWLMGTATATDCIEILIAGRVLSRICVGINGSQAPVYIAEIAKKEKQGALIIIQQLAIEWGILIIYYTGLFNFALGLHIPPGFFNIRYSLFVVFGALCLLAAVHIFFTYPEIAGKSLEDIRELFSPGGPKPWHTRRGDSPLDRMVNEPKDGKRQFSASEHMEKLRRMSDCIDWLTVWLSRLRERIRCDHSHQT